MFDALIRLVTQEPADTSEKAARPKPRFKALLRLDYHALVRGYIDGEEVCEIAGLGPIPVRVARDLLGESILKLVITKGVDVINVTHLGRKPTVAQQVASVVARPVLHPRGLHPTSHDCKRTTATTGPKPTTPATTNSTTSAPPTTNSKPATAGPSSKAPANAPWSHPTTPDTPRTNPNQTRDARLSHVPSSV